MCMAWWHVLHLHAIANKRVIYATITNIVRIAFDKVIIITNDNANIIKNVKTWLLINANSIYVTCINETILWCTLL